MLTYGPALEKLLKRPFAFPSVSVSSMPVVTSPATSGGERFLFFLHCCCLRFFLVSAFFSEFGRQIFACFSCCVFVLCPDDETLSVWGHAPARYQQRAGASLARTMKPPATRPRRTTTGLLRGDLALEKPLTLSGLVEVSSREVSILHRRDGDGQRSDSHKPRRSKSVESRSTEA